MSKVILCTTKEASHPFIFLNTKMEVNNYEELCFYIYNNTVLISKSSLSEQHGANYRLYKKSYYCCEFFAA